MKLLWNAVYTENRKLSRSPVLWGMLVFLLFVTGIRSGGADWNEHLGNMSFLFASVFGLMGFGTITAWVFGREYADRTVKDLLALPVSRTAIVIAKGLVIAGWCLASTLMIFGFSLLLGLLIGVPGFSWSMIMKQFGELLLIAVFHLLLCSPIALLASISRGYLVPIAYAFTTLMIALTAGPTALGAYLPWSIPALHLSMSGLTTFPLGKASYVILVLVFAVGALGTMSWWKRADHR
ncbi:ABC transporter permease [Saccharibacillus alkalitolerans]|uniref:ABC transporter permease subunit n=1 Tax=Saccharibacillus alkalitolerans TaxID=2705290 RepID=A0ABX0F8A4_9BACL|nr:ABC transporter permease [Saccharibacillus alkalitolerans]NGZ77183.1 ABC transporter permease subunit [Saccharibacillus alkalitolerans]